MILNKSWRQRLHKGLLSKQVIMLGQLLNIRSSAAEKFKKIIMNT